MRKRELFIFFSLALHKFIIQKCITNFIASLLFFDISRNKLLLRNKRERSKLFKSYRRNFLFIESEKLLNATRKNSRLHPSNSCGSQRACFLHYIQTTQQKLTQMMVMTVSVNKTHFLSISLFFFSFSCIFSLIRMMSVESFSFFSHTCNDNNNFSIAQDIYVL